MFLSRDAILSAQDLAYQELDIPEWKNPDGTPGRIRIREMTGVERDEFEASIIQQTEHGVQARWNNVRAKLVALIAVDAEGRPLFTVEDTTALGKKSAKVLNRLFEAGMDLSGIERKKVEEAVGN